MVGHSPKNKKLKARQPKENVLTTACGQSPWNKKSKAAQTNKDVSLSSSLLFPNWFGPRPYFQVHNTLLSVCEDRPMFSEVKAFKQTRSPHILINIPRDLSRKHAKNSKQGFAGISLDNTMK